MLFIFDMDNVLYDYDWRVRMRGLTALTGLDFPALRERWWHEEGEWAAERGVFPDAESYLAAFNAALGISLTPEEWVANRAEAMEPWPDSLDVVAEAATLGQVTLLTNNNMMTGAHLETIAPLLTPLFGEHRFTSAHYGERKPEPAVYQRVLDRYGMDAHDAFFADDMRVNVEGAESIGITGYHFGSAAGMRAAIRGFAGVRAAGA